MCRQCNRQALVPRKTVAGVKCRTCERSTTIDVETPEEYDRRVNYGFE